MKTFARTVSLVGIFLSLGGLVRAQQTKPSDGYDDAILNELRAIRQSLDQLVILQSGAGPRVPAVARLTVSRDTLVLGRSDAPLTMVEFVDLQCPYCRLYHADTFKQIKEHWIDTGKLRYVVRDFPLEDVHPQAMNAARAVRCAGEQGKAWDLRERLLPLGSRLSPEIIRQSAIDAGLKTEAFVGCSDSAKYDEPIRADITEGQIVGITGTPSFVLGVTTVNGVEGTVVVGAMPYARFDATLSDSLRTATNPSKPTR